MKQTVNDEKLKDKITQEEIDSVNKKADEVLAWMGTHPTATKEDYDAKQKDLETLYNPIMTKV